MGLLGTELAILGHGLLWIAIVNRSMGCPVPTIVGKSIALAGFACGAALLAWISLSTPGVSASSIAPAVLNGAANQSLLGGYRIVCWAACAIFVVHWARCRFHFDQPSWLVTAESRELQPWPGAVDCASRTTTAEGDVPRAASKSFWRLLLRFPGNETLTLEVVQREIRLPRLPASLDGAKIALLTDLHFTGRVPLEYYEWAAERINRLSPDLVLFGGDIVDDERLVHWVDRALPPYESTAGSFFVLGNHDSFHKQKLVRSRIRDAGITDLGGRWLEVPIRGETITLAGHEAPWIPPTPDFADAPPSMRSGDGRPRIVLAHTPDAIAWARRNDVDLVLAGHLHGGQIRLPGVGPIFSPSVHGVRFAQGDGLFYFEPTVLQVSRGVGGEFPIRCFCPPEALVLTLRSNGAE